MMNARLLFALSMAALLPACIPDPNADGSGSTTETAMVAGKLYRSDGKTPAAGAKVSIRLKNTHADTSGFGLLKRLADTATVITDDSGIFVFDSTLDTGLYVIEADDGDGNMALIDSVKVVDTDSAMKVEDTLRPAGAITGVVYLSEGGDPRKVFILALGLDRFTRPDSAGRFTFGNLAEAVYDLTLISSLDDYAVLEVPRVEVVSGGTRGLDTLRLKFTGIPTVRGIQISYDTLKQIVTLTWDKADSSLVKGYYVYRRNVDSNTVLARINVSPIVDPLYRDSTGIQGQTYEYRAAAVDQNATEGTKSSGASLHLVGVYQESQTSISTSQLRGIYLSTSGVLSVLNNAASSISALDTAGKIGTDKSIHDSAGNIVSGLRDICLDTSGNYYVTSDAGILKFDSSGQYLVTFDSASAPDVPYDIAIADSNIFVTFGHAIKKFNTIGGFLLEWANIETSSGFVRQPGGIALSGDTVFVFDELNTKVQIYSKLGAFLSAWGVQGELDGQFSQFPSKIAIDSNGRLFVAQQTSHGLKVQIFTKSGQYLGKFIAGVINNAPIGIAIDERNDIIYLATENQGTSASSISVFKKMSSF